MTTIDSETVLHVARLARLRLSDRQVDAQRVHFRQLLEMVSVIRQADTAGVEPLSHPLKCEETLRDDEPQADDRREALLALAPRTEDNLYLVPRVIE